MERVVDNNDAYLIEEFLEDLREDGFEDVPKTITAANVNERFLLPGVGMLGLLECATGWDAGSKELTEALLKLGAVITYKAMNCVFNGEQMFVLLEHGADPNMVNPKDGRVILEHVCDRDIEICFYLLDYGARFPPSMSNQPMLFEYATQTQSGIANCRRALLALVAYCKRSPYTALRTVYRELAKWIWRMRGGGPGCGPRSRIWVLEEDDDLN